MLGLYSGLGLGSSCSKRWGGKRLRVRGREEAYEGSRIGIVALGRGEVGMYIVGGGCCAHSRSHSYWNSKLTELGLEVEAEKVTAYPPHRP